jgi:hypothetical protein
MYSKKTTALRFITLWSLAATFPKSWGKILRLNESLNKEDRFHITRTTASCAMLPEERAPLISHQSRWEFRRRRSA